MRKKPELTLQTTTLWDYPSQHYGEAMQGDKEYAGATPSYVIWNLLQRYTRANDLVVDPMCGSGTTLDVARDLRRRALGYDIAPIREDIFRADARALPLETEKADFVFVDPPYSTHIDYSGAAECIGKLDALEPAYHHAMEAVIREIQRILRPGRYMGLYVSDSFRLKQPFAPIGFRLFGILERFLIPVDVVAVVRRNKTLKRRHYHTEAAKGNYFLRGFNYLFIFRKSAERARTASKTIQRAPKKPRPTRPQHAGPASGRRAPAKGPARRNRPQRGGRGR